MGVRCVAGLFRVFPCLSPYIYVMASGQIFNIAPQSIVPVEVL